MDSKRRVNITVDPEVHTKAKQLGLNVSAVAEAALGTYIQHLSSEEQAERGPLSSVFNSTQDDRGVESLPESDDPAGSHRSSLNWAESATPVEEILDEYEAYGTTVLDRSEATIDQHTRYVERLLRDADKPPDRITENDIVAYINSEQPMSQSKRQNILSAMKTFFREFVGSDVADSFEHSGTTPNPTVVPTKDELQTFYDAIENPKYRVVFLMYATSGLRSSELVELTTDDIDEDARMLVPDKQSEVKKTWASFYNEEAERAYETFKPERNDGDERIFQVAKPTVNITFRKISEESGVKITPQMLRRWFASEMSSLGVDASYIDAFCGRTPTSVLEEHYLDYSPRKLKQIYDDAGLTVLE